MADKSRAKLVEFIDMLASKGLMNKNTVSARKAAVNAILGVLTPEEGEDVTSLDLDELGQRFKNLYGTKFTPDSLKVYISRARSTIEDFKSYCADPATFKPSVGAPRNPGPSKGDNGGAQRHASRAAEYERFAGEVVFPVPIRPDLIVKIVGLPSDLTKNEATKIANVINALAVIE
jgi:hypothetical protein